MTPSPPAWAMAMASFDSVTVSMAAEMIGMESAISRVMRVAVETSAGSAMQLPPDADNSAAVCSHAKALREEM